MSQPKCPSCGGELCVRRRGRVRIRECDQCTPRQLFDSFRSFL